MILILAVAVSLSRGGVVSLCAGLAAFAGVRYWSRREKRLAPGRLLVAGAVAAGLLAAVVAVLPVEARNRVASLAGITSEQSGSFRLGVWRDTLRLVSSSPWLGSGFGAFQDALPRFKTAAGHLAVEHAESDHLELLAEGGLVGAGTGGNIGGTGSRERPAGGSGCPGTSVSRDCYGGAGRCRRHLGARGVRLQPSHPVERPALSGAPRNRPRGAECPQPGHCPNDHRRSAIGHARDGGSHTMDCATRGRPAFESGGQRDGQLEAGRSGGGHGLPDPQTSCRRAGLAGSCLAAFPAFAERSSCPRQLGRDPRPSE